MEPVSPGFPPGGVFLSLLTESFAVRALLGSVLALALAALALRGGWVQSPRARRLVLLGPVVTAAVAAGASLAEAEAYLPKLWVASSGSGGQVLELLGEMRVISNARNIDVLFLAWLAVAVILCSRRVWGAVRTARLLRRAETVANGHPLQRTADRLAGAMGTRRAQVRLLPACPGGAFAAATRHPVIVVDPSLLATLDPHEAEGVVAHEMAHVARRDVLLAVVVGLIADLTFFLPPVRLAGRWLHREREEGADELASQHTRRPAALASGILKVYEGASRQSHPLHACAVAAPAALPARFLRPRRPHLSYATRTVAARVERLVVPSRRRSPGVQAAEVVVAVALVLAASVAAVAVPRWVVTELDAYSLAFVVIPPPVESVESPAFATFRYLAPVEDTTKTLHGYERSLIPSSTTVDEGLSGCPCVESQAQWFAGVPAAVPDHETSMAWRRTTRPTWDVRPAGSLRARPLLTVSESQVGFFVVAENRP